MQLEFPIEEEERLKILQVALECLYFIFNQLFLFFEPEYFLDVLTFDYSAHLLFGFIDFIEKLISSDMRIIQVDFQLGVKIRPRFLVDRASEELDLASVILDELPPLVAFVLNHLKRS